MGRRQDNTTRLSSKTLVETAREKGAGGRGENRNTLSLLLTPCSSAYFKEKSKSLTEQYWEAGGFQALIYPVF